MRQVVANGNRQGVQALTTTREHQLSEEAEIVNRKSRIVNEARVEELVSFFSKVPVVSLSWALTTHRTAQKGAQTTHDS